MKFSYDPEVDAFNLRLSNARIDDTDEVAPGIIVDYDENGEVVAIEMLNVRKRSAQVEIEIPRMAVSSFHNSQSPVVEVETVALT